MRRSEPQGWVCLKHAAGHTQPQHKNASAMLFSPFYKSFEKNERKGETKKYTISPFSFSPPFSYPLSLLHELLGGGVAGVPVASALPAATLCSWALPGLRRRQPFPLGWRGNCAFLPRRMETGRSTPIFTIHSPDPCKAAQLGRCPCPARCLQPSTDGSLWPGGG